MSVYENHRMADPRLPFIIHDTSIPANRRSARENWHENVELLYFKEGSGFVTENENHISVSAGDIVVLNANALHAIASIDAIHYYCLIVDRSFCLANHFDTNSIRFQSLLRDRELSVLMECLIQEYRTEETRPYRVQMIRSTVLRIMAILCDRYGGEAEEQATDSRLLSAMKQALGYVHANSDRDLSLDEMAELVGLSKFYFAREFRRITGETFVSYVNLIRCERAKTLLLEGQTPIGEVSRICGFANQSYFTKTFVKHIGVLPSAYRNRGRQESEL